MYEVEVKVRADHETVRTELADTSAERLGRVEQTDTYFDAPHRDMAARDEALRLREERQDGTAEVAITYKGPLVEAESKTREEFETGVESAAEMEAILQGLGFSPAATVEKERTRYRLEGFTISLDTVAGLGEFVEIEAEASEGEIGSTRERAIEVLDSIGLDAEEQIRTSYLGLLLAERE